MKTELGNIIANEAIYQLQFYKELYLTHKKINKKFLILFLAIIICLIAFHVFYYLEFNISNNRITFINFIFLRLNFFYVMSTNFV